MKYYKYKMDIGVGNALSFLIAIPLFIIYYLMFPNFYESITYAKMPILLLWFILHEMIHFFGYLINKEINSFFILSPTHNIFSLIKLIH